MFQDGFIGAENDCVQAAVTRSGLRDGTPSPTHKYRGCLAASASGNGNFPPVIAIGIAGGRDKQSLLACSAFEETQMKIVIQKLNGLWHLIVGSCRIRTPFLETQDRALVVTYARRAYPGAKIFQRD